MLRFRKTTAVFTALLLCAGLLLSCRNFVHEDYSDISGENTQVEINSSDTSNEIEKMAATENAVLSTAVEGTSDNTTEAFEDSAPATPASMTLCFMGDIMCLSGQQYSASIGDGKHDYTGNYRLLQPVFDECDFVMGNLETCLAPSSPYSAAAKKIDGRPNCNAPADLLDSLTAVGFTHVVTANNHCLDADKLGIYETLAALDASGITHTGTHTPETADYSGADYMMIRTDDICVAVISVTELINRRDLVTPAAMHLYVNEYSPDFFTEKIKAARGEGATYVVVYEHWGNENTHDLLDIQKEHARVIANAGADLIIGSHSHCVQPMEDIETADGRVVRCYYSLGNLVSSMEKEINHDTVLVKVNLSWDGTDEGKALVSEIDSIPCHMIWNLDGVRFVVAPTDCDTGHESNNNELKEAEERIWGVLEGKRKGDTA